MKRPVTEILLDVGVVAPSERHTRIFKIWSDLSPDTSLRLFVDHDPLPLYYQFAAEHAGEFHWEYLQSGPANWQVRIARGSFDSPGFIPSRRNSVPAVPVEFADLSELTRTNSGGSPHLTRTENIAHQYPKDLLLVLQPSLA